MLSKIMESPCDYEEERSRRIAENMKRLAELGVVEVRLDFESSAASKGCLEQKRRRKKPPSNPFRVSTADSTFESERVDVRSRESRFSNASVTRPRDP